MSEDNTKFSVVGKLTVIKNMILNDELNNNLLKDLDEMLDAYIDKNTKDIVLNEDILKYLFLGWCISNLAKE